MLTKKKKAYFSKLLNEMLDELLTEGNNTVNSINSLDGRLPDPSDRATVESERHFTLRKLERENGLIGKIEEALARLGGGTYGICEECEEEISEGRLKARPVTTLCIECKTQQEEDEKVKGL